MKLYRGLVITGVNFRPETRGLEPVEGVAVKPVSTPLFSFQHNFTYIVSESTELTNRVAEALKGLRLAGVYNPGFRYILLEKALGLRLPDPAEVAKDDFEALVLSKVLDFIRWLHDELEWYATIAIHVEKDGSIKPLLAVELPGGDGELVVVPPIALTEEATEEAVGKVLENIVDEIEHEITKELVSKLRNEMYEAFIDEHAWLAEEALKIAESSAEASVASQDDDALEVLGEGYGLEEEGRELAYRLTTTRDVYQELDAVEKWSREAKETVKKIEKLVSESGAQLQGVDENIIKVAQSLSNMFGKLSSDARAGVLSSATLEAIRSVDEKFQALFGQRVVWHLGSDWASAVNNATAAFHRLLDIVSSYVAGRALILSSNPSAQLWSRAFLSSVKLLEKGERIYVADEDVGFATIVIKDSEILMRLGSSPGHAARVDLVKGVLYYYDADEDVVDTMVEIIKKFVPVKHHSYDDAHNTLNVYFDPTPENVKKLCAVMPLAVSMDYRLRSLKEDAEDVAHERLEEIKQSEGFEGILRLYGYKGSVAELKKRIREFLLEYLKPLETATPEQVSNYLRELLKDQLSEVEKSVRSVVAQAVITIP